MKIDEDFLAEDERLATENGYRVEAYLIRTKRERDAELRRKYQGVKSCPKRNFKPCIQDECSFFINEYPGRPWWGCCAYRAMAEK